MSVDPDDDKRSLQSAHTRHQLAASGMAGLVVPKEGPDEEPEEKPDE